MSADYDKIVERVRKLMNLAKNDGASEGEVENALRFARKLMDEYALSEADLYENEDRKAETYGSMVDELAHTRKNFDVIDLRMFQALQYIFDVRVYKRESWSSGKRCWTLRVYGLPRDVAIAKAMHSQLMVTMRSMSRLRMGPGWNKPHWEYCRGFTYRLILRAREMKQASAGPCTAVVLAKDNMLRKFAEEKLNLERAKSRALTVRDSNAWSVGSRDANDVHLGTDGLKSGSTPQKYLT